MTTWRRTTKMIGCTGALRLDSSTARPRGIAPPRGTPTNLAKFEQKFLERFMRGSIYDRTPRIYGAHDRAGRFETHHTPCTESADGRAGRFETHRTPCTQSADGRARRLRTHRTPCIDGATSRGDKHRTPCIATDTSPRASHGPFVGGAPFRFVPCFATSSPPLSVSSTSPSSSRVTLTFGRQIDGIPPRTPRSAAPDTRPRQVFHTR